MKEFKVKMQITIVNQFALGIKRHQVCNQPATDAMRKKHTPEKYVCPRPPGCHGNCLDLITISSHSAGTTKTISSILSYQGLPGKYCPDHKKLLLTNI